MLTINQAKKDIEKLKQKAAPGVRWRVVHAGDWVHLFWDDWLVLRVHSELWNAI